MDTQLATWEMNLEPYPVSVVKEELATGPMEPYFINPDQIHPN
jgi:hypothetical protein